MLASMHAARCRFAAKGEKQTSKILSCKLATWTTCKLVASRERIFAKHAKNAKRAK